jgi:hypothetical protein
MPEQYLYEVGDIVKATYTQKTGKFVMYLLVLEVLKMSGHFYKVMILEEDRDQYISLKNAAHVTFVKVA